MEYRRLGRLGHESSVLIYGAASLWEVTPEVAEASVTAALEAGVNHIDTAASYGLSEERLGGFMPSIRDRVFLASKTQARDAEGAWASINQSLELLRTDRLDLIQLHEVHNVDLLDQVTRKGGALEALVRARDEGMVGGIGITGHTHDVPASHTEALRRFDFDSVLLPLNRVLWGVPGYAEAYTGLVAAAQARDTAVITMKTTARRNWVGEKRYSTWYEPFDEQRLITASVAWVLNGHPEVTGIATAGETALLAKMIAAEQARAGMTAEEAAAELDALPDDEYASVYDEHMPT
ncbi:MAG TPA: aldo/keto reductase [Propionibacterium sp.]|nr:aldo/keto reductase [Propionibacterium sp.]